MFEKENIKVLHVEPTTVCNAACPQCARENPALYNDSVNRSSLTVDQISKLLKTDFIKQLDKMFMCGNFGDPATSHESLLIFEYFRSVNPNIEIGMNTNGGVQSTKWWTSLGSLFNRERDYCVFSIDGLEDTNHLYRRNVNFNKVISNAQSFIDAGGKAHWDMLVFEHNEHQIEDCLNLAREMGFTWFRAKVSKRFQSTPVVGINPPRAFSPPTIDKKSTIKCYANNEKSLYLSASGEIYPCCWVGNYVFTKDSKLQAMLDSENYKLLTDTWKDNPFHVCKDNCSIATEDLSVFEKQWFRNEQLR